jgi:glyoxylase-like metal-dependent hydrolase (beta-lactamase superfamily II)
MVRILPVVLLALLSGRLTAQAQAASKVLTVESLADGVWQAETDQEVNAGWFLLGDAVVAVDSGSDEATGKAILQKIAETARKPVRFLVITHAHADHAGGVAPFVAAGATVICQENAATGVGQLVATESKSRSGLMVVFDGLGFVGGSRRVAIYYMGAAHSRGDIVVFLPDDKVLFTGDVVSTKRIPYMQSPDVDPQGWEKILSPLLQIDADRIAPGHGPSGNKESIAATLAYVHKVNQLAQQMVADDVADALVEAKIKFKESTVNEALVLNVKAAIRAEKARLAAGGKAAGAPPAAGSPTSPARTPTPASKKK